MGGVTGAVDANPSNCGSLSSPKMFVRKTAASGSHAAAIIGDFFLFENQLVV